jgi:hypothetical protein
LIIELVIGVFRRRVIRTLIVIKLIIIAAAILEKILFGGGLIERI